MSRRDANIRHTASNRITSGPGMVSNLDDDNQAAPRHSVNDREDFAPQIAQATAAMGAMNGYDKLDAEHGLTQLDSEEAALAAVRAYSQPGVFDIDKLIVAAAAYKFHTQK